MRLASCPYSIQRIARHGYPSKERLCTLDGEFHRSVHLQRHPERLSQRRRYSMSTQKHRTSYALLMHNGFQMMDLAVWPHSPARRMGVLGPPQAPWRPLASLVVLAALLCLASCASDDTPDTAPTVTPNPNVIVEQGTDLGEVNGRHYLQVEGVMVGTFARQDGSAGSYRTPLRMAFPAPDAREGNGVGLVDVPNSADFNVLSQLPLTEENITQWALRATGDYL